MKIISKEPSNEEWSRFLREGLNNWTEENPRNVKFDFTKMTKLFGLSYIFLARGSI